MYRRLLAAGLVLVASAQPAWADGYTYTVAPNIKQFSFPGGESQSAVVPPGKKSQCPDGRLLVSDDRFRPPLAPGGLSKAIHWRDLTAPNTLGKSGTSSFASSVLTVGTGPQVLQRQRLWSFGAADHRLVTLPDGDVLYQLQTFTREKIEPPLATPPWFGVTFRGGFGPGARTTLATWRSSNCGLTFDYLTDIDSYGPGYEECAGPQPKAQSLSPNFDMGGTDGPNLVVDRDTGTAYSVFQCAGRLLTKDASGGLSLGDFISKTYVFSLAAGAKKFENRGSYRPNQWGPQAIPLAGNRLAVSVSGIGQAFEAGIIVGLAKGKDAKFNLAGEALTIKGVRWGWEPPDLWGVQVATGLQQRVAATFAGNTLLTRVPSKSSSEALLLAFPAMVVKKTAETETKTWGYRLFVYETPGATPFETDAIIPTGNPATSMIMHVTAIDPGEGGPVLLYWYDLDASEGASGTGRIRGRLINHTSFSTNDRDIALVGGKEAPFPLSATGPYWFGDYKSAEGFHSPKVATSKLGPSIHTYRYFPVWIQPDGTVRYTEITATRTATGQGPFEEKLMTRPEFRIVDECCDFGPLFTPPTSKGETDPRMSSLRREMAVLASELLIADPNLRHPNLRIEARPKVRRQQHQTVLTPTTRVFFKDQRDKFILPEQPLKK